MPEQPGLRGLVGDAIGRKTGMHTIKEKGKVTGVREDFEDKSKTRVETDVGGEFGQTFTLTNAQAAGVTIGSKIEIEIKIEKADGS